MSTRRRQRGAQRAPHGHKVSSSHRFRALGSLESLLVSVNLHEFFGAVGSDPFTIFLLGPRFPIPDRGTTLGSGCQSVRMLVALGFANT